MEETTINPVFYVGQSEVESIAVTEGIDLVGVLYKSGKSEDFTTEQWECVKSVVPYADGEISIKKHEALMVRILKLMVKSRVTLGEHDWILDQIHASVGENYRKSISVLYNVTNTEKIMLADIDHVLTDKPKEVSEDIE